LPDIFSFAVPLYLSEGMIGVDACQTLCVQVLRPLLLPPWTGAVTSIILHRMVEVGRDLRRSSDPTSPCSSKAT